MNGGAIRSVWKDNFQAESAVLCSIARRTRHVALSVQCPAGCAVAAQAAGGEQGQFDQQLTAEERYQVVTKANVDVLLKPIQVGLAVFTDDGELFVFEFNLNSFDHLMEMVGGESSVERPCLQQ